MHAIDLVEYIRHGMILKNIAENKSFDAIIYETFTNQDIELPDTIVLHTLDTDNQTHINGQLMAYTQQYDRVLIILDSLQLQHILPLLEHLHAHTHDDQHVTIMNLGAGVTGLANKGIPELHDISLAYERQIPTYEAVDFISFFKLLTHQKDYIHYLRVPAVECIGTLIDDVDPTNAYIDLSALGYTGTAGTLLCAAGYAHQLLQANELLKAQGKDFDLFLMSSYNLPEAGDSLLASLEKTKKLTIILDQHEHTLYKHIIQSRLFEQGIDDLERLELITPDTTNLTISPTRSLYEQADLHAEGLAKQLF